MLGDVVVTELELQPDDATRRRLAEMLLFVEPPPVAARPVQGWSDPHDAGADVLTLAAERRWSLIKARASRWLASAGGPTAVAVVAAGLWVLGVAVASGWSLTALAAALAALFAVALGIRASGWRGRRLQPVPSDLLRLGFRHRGSTVPEALAPPGDSVDPDVEPLFVPGWTTGILTAALSVQTPDGPIDVDRLVDAVARLHVPSPLPRKARRSIDSGVQVLIDLSDDMLPFREDILGMLRRLRRVFGRDRVTVLRFAGRPLTQIGTGRRATWGTYQPPRAHQPVLVITNFGLSLPPLDTASAATQREWAALVPELLRQRCPLVAFVPNDVTRVPAELRRLMSVVQWDRTTSAASASRARRG